MAGSRTLKLSILAETRDLVAGLNTASRETESFGDKATAFGRKAALAFAVAGTAALAFAADAVKAASEDAAAQKTLADTIKATTDATASQIRGVEEYITKTSIAIGVTDDQLRPAFSRLVRSTKDTEEAQRLLNLALDLSVASGRPVETVANALGKAYDGNTTALAKLGLGLDSNLLKSGDNKRIIEELELTYGRFAEGAAETAAVKFERIRIATDEAKESIGAALLPVVEQLADFVLETVVPNLDSFIKGLTGEGSLTEASANATDGAFEFGEQVRKVIKTVIDLKDELKIVAQVLGTLFVVSRISAAVSATIALIRSVIAVYNSLRAAAIVAGVAGYFALNPLAGLAAVGIAAAVLAGAYALANNDGGVSSAPSTGAIPFSSGFTAPSGSPTTTTTTPRITVPSTTGITTAARTAATAAAAATNVVSSGFNAGRFREAEAASMGTTINLTVTGAFDREGTARTIVETLNSSAYRGTGGAGNLVGIA